MYVDFNFKDVTLKTVHLRYSLLFFVDVEDYTIIHKQLIIYLTKLFWASEKYTRIKILKLSEFWKTTFKIFQNCYLSLWIR